MLVYEFKLFEMNAGILRESLKNPMQIYLKSKVFHVIFFFHFSFRYHILDIQSTLI